MSNIKTDGKNITVSNAWLDQLAAATDYDRSIMLLTNMLETLMETPMDIAESLKMKGSVKKAYLGRSRKDALRGMLKKPPPNIDKEVLEVFCKQHHLAH